VENCRSRQIAFKYPGKATPNAAASAELAETLQLESGEKAAFSAELAETQLEATLAAEAVEAAEAKAAAMLAGNAEKVAAAAAVEAKAAAAASVEAVEAAAAAILAGAVEAAASGADIPVRRNLARSFAEIPCGQPNPPSPLPDAQPLDDKYPMSLPLPHARPPNLTGLKFDLLHLATDDADDDAPLAPKKSKAHAEKASKEEEAAAIKASKEAEAQAKKANKEAAKMASKEAKAEAKKASKEAEAAAKKAIKEAEAESKKASKAENAKSKELERQRKVAEKIAQLTDQMQGLKRKAEPAGSAEPVVAAAGDAAPAASPCKPRPQKKNFTEECKDEGCHGQLESQVERCCNC